MQKDFYINDQFLVKPGANIVIDGKISRISRISPRTMQLLCTLADRAGKNLSKEELISIAWNGKDNEEEFLQSMTELQKVLQNDKKEILRIVPRKTYSLSAVISNADIADLTREAGPAMLSGNAGPGQKWIFVLSILIILLALIFVLYNYTWAQGRLQTV
jgi:DNA-binding winged helix-turn-helix (wHTH) protein